MRAGRRSVAVLVAGAYEAESCVPSSRAASEAGSTPDPESLRATSRVAPRRTAGVSSRADGGVVSLIQKRKRNGPARDVEGVSKTTSYVPGAGRIAAATGSSLPKVGR